MNSAQERIHELVEQRKLYQATMMRRTGAGLRYYEDLLRKNTYQLLDLGANVFEIDDANRKEVEEWGMRMKEMSFFNKLRNVLKYWLSPTKN